MAGGRMTLKVSKLLHTFARHGGAQRTNKFRVRFPSLRMSLINRALGYDQADTTDLNVLCVDAEVPGMTLDTAVRKHGPRSGTQVAAGYEVKNAAFTFLETTDGLIRTYLEHWFDNIIDEYGHLAFYDDISTDIYVDTLDAEGNVTMTVRLMGCYPLTRATYKVSNDDNKAMELSVEFFVKDIDMTTGREGKIQDSIRDARRVVNAVRGLSN